MWVLLTDERHSLGQWMEGPRMDTAQLQDTQQWAHQTFGGCELGDKRRTRRLVRTAGHLGERPEHSLSAACPDEAERLAAHRLMENDQIDPEAISEGGFAAAAEQASAYPLLLAASDTTVVSFPHDSVQEQLGDTGGPADRSSRGHLVHSSLLMDAQSQMTVGLIDQQWWTREVNRRGRKHQRKHRPYETKESYKWQQTSENIEARLGSERMSRVIELADAEADIYEFLQYKQQRQHRYVVHIGQDRALSDHDERLWAHLADQPELGRMTVDLPQKGNRKARRVTVRLRAATMGLRPPHRRQGNLAEMTQSAVLAEEIDPPADAQPLRWRLYTSEPVDTAEQVQQVVQYYRCRWRVEEFHRTWKSDCRVEQSRQQSEPNLQRMARTLTFVVVRLLQLREHARYQPEQPCDRVLSDEQWQCLWLSTEDDPLPEQPPSARWAFYAVARLGGFYDSKRTGRVGTKALYRGWQCLNQYLVGYRLAHQTPNL